MKIEITMAESFELTNLLVMVKSAADAQFKKSRGFPREQMKRSSDWASHFVRKIADAGSKEIDGRKG